MRGKKGHHKATGGAASDDPSSGSKLYDEDLKTKPKRYNESKVEDEAEEKKHGGRAKRHKRRHGGHVHHEDMGELKHAHHVGKIHGHKGGHKGRSARKHGGRTGSNFNPLSSAHSGEAPKGHKTTD